MSVDKDTLVLFRFQNGIQKDECGHVWTSTNIQETSKNTKSGFGITTNSRDGRLYCENPGFCIGGADFTIDYWLYDVHNGGGYRTHFSLGFGGGFWDIFIDCLMPNTSATTYNLRCNSYTFTAFTFPGIFASLKHYAFVYEHTKKIITMYVDGKENVSRSVEIARRNVANITLLNHSGGDNIADTGAVMSAFRISNCARWTSNFDAGGANVA